MLRSWLSFIVHSMLIITVLTNTVYAHTTIIAPAPITHCSSDNNDSCCDNPQSITNNTLTSHCDDDCNGNDCSSQHQSQPALLSSFSFQSIDHRETPISALGHSPRYYHEPLLKPPMA